MENEIPGEARRARWITYAIAFGITTLIFGTALFVSNYFNDVRAAEIRAAQDNISIDILSIETQFDLLAEQSCRDISESSILSTELRSIAERLSYLEGQSGVDTEELTSLKRYYSLLQIKDILLMQRVSEKCRLNPVFLLYFYSNEGDCDTCEEQGDVLTELSRDYPQLRVYSFDYNLSVSPLRTLININNVENDLPALVIKENVYYGFRDSEAIKEILPELAELKTATSTDKTTEAKNSR